MESSLAKKEQGGVKKARRQNDPGFSLHLDGFQKQVVGVLLQPLWATESFVYFSNLRGVDSSHFWRISSFLTASKPCSARTCSHTQF